MTTSEEFGKRKLFKVLRGQKSQRTFKVNLSHVVAWPWKQTGIGLFMNALLCFPK